MRSLAETMKNAATARESSPNASSMVDANPGLTISETQ